METEYHTFQIWYTRTPKIAESSPRCAGILLRLINYILQFVGCAGIVIRMNRLSRTILVFLLLVGVLLGASFYFHKAHSSKLEGTNQAPLKSGPVTTVTNETLPLNTHVISPQGVHILVRVADTDKTRELGLSYFDALPDGQGMLFVFPQMGTYSFWMKDMNFPLDIVWIDEHFKIIDRVINAPASSYPKTFTPASSASYAIELPVNTADRDGFVVGKSIVIQNDK